MTTINKKLALGLTICSMLLSNLAFADCDPRFYIGGEVSGTHNQGGKKLDVTIEGTERKIPLSRGDKKNFIRKAGASIGGFVGSRINEYVGVEAGYNYLFGKYNREKGLVVQKNPKTRHHNIYADLLGYVPVADCFELIGTVGLGQLRSKVSGLPVTILDRTGRLVAFTNNASLKAQKLGVRVGAGVGYKVNENLSARLMVRYQQGNKLIKNVTSAGIGLIYQF